jgi:hypothetical protein
MSEGEILLIDYMAVSHALRSSNLINVEEEGKPETAQPHSI